MKKKELVSTDVVAIEMVTETIARMFGLKIKPKSINVKLAGQYSDNPLADWLASMKHGIPEIDYLNAKNGFKEHTWKRIVVTVQASFEYGGGQLSPKFDCTIFKLGSLIYPYDITLHTPNGEGTLRVIRYEWIRSIGELIQSGVADPANFKNYIALN